ncbi:hypothetical protein CMUS01_13112 [Colletotrichum musicola]|uniref:Uncharacterized protein n=1 Tax=Colletotrichum musicola TaxID=2175873 RepID=A0A8H6MXV5_9PEZI|nr:hypothetical protein CMUS01_13112 [Colletotrichum musicola]
MICAFRSLIGPTGADHSLLPQPFASKASLHSQKACGGLSPTGADLRRRQSPTTSLIFGGRSIPTPDDVLSKSWRQSTGIGSHTPQCDMPAPVGFDEHTYGANKHKKAGSGLVSGLSRGGAGAFFDADSFRCRTGQLGALLHLSERPPVRRPSRIPA